MVYNPGPLLDPSPATASPYGAIRPPCQDDDLDFRQLLSSLHDSSFDPSQYPPAFVTCQNVDSLAHICTKSTIDHHPISSLVRTVCPGTCRNYCDAVVNPHNRTVLVEDLFEKIERFRTMVHQQINVDLENIRSITTLPFSSGAITAREAHALLNGPLPRTTPYQAAFQR